ncbi:binding-protein-dependent transport systems inner membrane component [Catenulispora acidiphila DSM 44928]|uniref:Binding-protein-dependent transport systems inner membrane component n=1 Tax=Catenulispora acidiphila (strain DSM 44928 / JCM 14897 / NBRC 102108 / NRRL B-24433 / ID139908) TaxID=479433 RepID=C7Q6W3_CATAD|nr:ABC transporter permease [Catenulispora acidiphila]ACU75976.1 binding-protein-dependent transport systems inner membrane component [Catenulispora acidiphila DSM 44928]
MIRSRPSKDLTKDPGRPRTPAALAWRRFRADRTGMAAGVVVVLFFLLGLCAPLISAAYGKDPYTTYGQNEPGLLDEFGYPTGALGGAGGRFWLGLEPGLGRDVFTQLLYGIRTSLLISAVVVLIITVLGTAVGLIAGYAGGWLDAGVSRIVDIALSFPSTLFIIAFVPVVQSLFVSADRQTPTWMRVTTLVVVLAAFGWAPVARLLRGQVISLRGREFVEAARIGGASPIRIVRRELLPNLWTPILVTASLSVPVYVTTEAALSFLGAGIDEPTPDWGRMIHRGAEVYLSDITYMLIPGVAILIFVVAFNLLGDSVRDALSPSGR